MGTSLHPPQVIVGARGFYAVWLPADPDAVAKLVPEGLTPAEGCPVFMNQYRVDDPAQTSSYGLDDAFGSYSLTYLGADLANLDAAPEVPGRWWTHYFNSSEPMSRYAEAHGVPAVFGSAETTLEIDGSRYVGTTILDGAPVLRTIATVELGNLVRATGQLRYITRVGGGFTSGRYAFVADIAETLNIESIEFLDPNHPIYQLRPADPLTVTFGIYYADMSFCYPGGEGPVGSTHGR
ncbi:MAG: hypothetical protein AB1679_18240 [Actinomycetota bacterium]|jgi:hypothetical protein